MHIELDPGSPVPLYRQVVEQVRLALASGVLRPGDRLPGIRELAERAAVNPLTVVRAYNELIAEGVLEARQGLGTFVAQGARRMSQLQKEKVVRDWAEELVSRAVRLGLEKGQLLRIVGELFEKIEGEKTPDASGRRF
jgi:GntR family transcriptional regulator